MPWALLHPLPFEREVSVDGFRLSPGAGVLVPSFLVLADRVWVAAAADARLSGLGWTEALTLEDGLGAPRWAVAGRWAPPALSARPAPVGLAGPVVADGAEGPGSAPRGAWRASGVLGGPLAGGYLGAVLSLDASGVGLPPTEAGLAGGGRARQALALTTTWLPGPRDRLFLLALAGRRSESPDCFRCTDAAARVDRELALFAGLGWVHGLGPASALELRLGAEHRSASAGARSPTDAPSRLDLTRWITDGAPGPLGPELGASILEESRTRVRLSGAVHAVLGLQRLDGGVEGWLEGGRRVLSLPGGVRFLDRGTACAGGSTEECAYRVEVEPLDASSGGWALAGHLQDTLRLGPIGLRAGLRLDVAQASTGESSTGLRLGLGPRLSLVWDVTGDGRHWLVAHAGRSHDPELPAATARAVLPRQRMMAWSNGAFDGCARPGPACVQLGGPAGLASGGLPRTDEVALGWRGRPARGVEGGFEARWRRTSQLWTEEETGLLTNADGQWTSHDGAWTSRRVVAADDRAWRQALGLGVWARARAGPARVLLNWTMARVTGTASGPFDPWLADARTAAFAAGPLPDDRRHRVEVSIALLAHAAVELGARLRYATGGPLWETFGVPGSPGLRTIRGARGTGVLSSAPVALRDPDVFTADAWVRLRLGTLFPGVLPRLDLTVEAVQVAGGNTPVHLSPSAGRLGAVLRREPPFQLVLGIRAGN
ncbi:MAG: hypothetical protein EHM78_11965 [Myxococcaceae bacterium]|nr:MAG: hypothetical protein EHM78_11965 [Myxococcaceae bacterium]